MKKIEVKDSSIVCKEIETDSVKVKMKKDSATFSLNFEFDSESDTQNLSAEEFLQIAETLTTAGKTMTALATPKKTRKKKGKAEEKPALQVANKGKAKPVK